MTDNRIPSEETFGLNDNQLAARTTVFAPESLKGHTVLISGGAGGIGRATAWLFARIGARVLLAGRSQAKLDALQGRLAEAGLKTSSYTVDIRNPESVQSLFDRIQTDHGAIDGLINSAGGQFPQAAIDYSINGWNTVINTNLNGTWYMMQAAARHWRDAAKSGSIVNIVVPINNGVYGIAHTVAARAGVIALSRQMSVEWAPLKIRVNCIAPGTIETEGWKVYTPEARATYPRTNPMMRAGNSWDIAEACAYLTAQSGNFITGDLMTIDGGAQHWGELWTTAKPDYFRS